MAQILRSRPVVTEEKHRPTLFEIFFDLVFVFALTRVTAFMSHRPSWLTMAQGLLVLLLLWISWLIYSWLGNQARADIGLIRAGTTVAMAAIFVAAVVIPDAWGTGTATILDPQLILAVAYIVVRVLHLAMYFWAAAGNRRLRTTLILFTISTALSWIPLILGAMFGSTAQIVLWTVALAVDFFGGFLASVLSGWHVRSLRHFAERHSLVLIIALGESLISVNAGAGVEMTHPPAIVATLLAFAVTVCLWRLYYENVATAARAALSRQSGPQRDRLAANAYSVVHFPLIAGTMYIALGIEQVLAHLAHDHSHDNIQTRLSWASTVALFGGAAVYLAGRVAFLRITVRTVTLEMLLAPCAALLLLPAGRFLPGLAALGLLASFLLALTVFETLSRAGAGRSDTGDPGMPDRPVRHGDRYHQRSH
ncbi:low temperature requirement protein A [Rugosimonospora africana]|uniref:low temperature requirement protein A n=1 Tax=Rugosimonospora africana TaxID=556532 RepID=UPI0019434E09|nr:low temperature requirement protein A [Rugosimonospora africana]